MPPQIHRGIVLRFLRQGASAATRRMNPLSGVAGEARGKHSQIVLEYNGYRGGQPLYGYGPLE